MGNPSAYLPPALSSEQVVRLFASIGLPQPATVQPLKVSAQYHSIYLVSFAGDAAARLLAIHNHLLPADDGTVALILRVSGRHLPRIKTLNELGVMAWVKQNTSIPVPAVIAYDASESNAIGHEYSVMEKARGVSIDTVYHALSPAAKESLLNQLIDFLVQLHEKPFSAYMGGLAVANGEAGMTTGKGPMLDENYWTVPEIDQYWSTHETVDSLNPTAANGYPSYVAFVSASVELYAYAIGRHESLSSYRDLIPRLKAFVAAINSPQNELQLNDVRYVLAHRDLHYGNIMCDPSTEACRITAVLDWEFSAVVAEPRWNPQGAFLWTGKSGPGDKLEQAAMEQRFEDKCRSRGAAFLLDAAQLNDRQQLMQTLASYLRAIVEVCPRGQAQDQVQGWRATVEASLAAFGV